MSKKRSGTMRSNIIKDNLFCWSLLILPFINFLIFYAYANLEGVLMGFRSYIDNSYSLINFERLILEWNQNLPNGIRMALKNSLIFSVWSSFLVTPLVVVYSYFIFKKCLGSSLFKILFFIPSIVNGVVTALLKVYMLDAGGPIMIFMQNMGVNFSEDLLQRGFLSTDKTALMSLLLYQLTTTGGVTLLLYVGTMKRIPEEIFESARIDGATFLTEIKSIILPLIWPVMSILYLTIFTSFMTAEGGVRLTTQGSNNTMTMGFFMWQKLYGSNVRGLYTLNYPSAINILITILSIPIVLTTRFLFNKMGGNYEY